MKMSQLLFPLETNFTTPFIPKMSSYSLISKCYVPSYFFHNKSLLIAGLSTQNIVWRWLATEW
jgi:hypothetical protein